MKRGETVLVGGIFTVLSITVALGGVALHRHGLEIDRLRGQAKYQHSENENRLKALENEIARHRENLSALEEQLPQAMKAEDRCRFPKGASTQSLHHTPEFLAMTPCVATLLSKNPCTGTFKDAGGAQFHIGGPASSRPIRRFIRTLEEGKSYELPAAFIEFLDKGEWELERVGKARDFVEETF